MIRLIVPIIIALLLLILVKSISLKRSEDSEPPIDVEPESASSFRSERKNARDKDPIDVEPLDDKVADDDPIVVEPLEEIRS